MEINNNNKNFNTLNKTHHFLEKGFVKRRTTETLLNKNVLKRGKKLQGRAREEGEINKSLLTLGCVINALIEHSGHVPYRYYML